MRSGIFVIAVVGILSGGVGCGGWFEGLAKNPVYAVEQALLAAERALQLARLVFDQLKPLLPGAAQTVAETKYQALVVEVVKAQEALAKGLEVARRAKEAEPKLEALRAALVSSGEALATFLEGLKGGASGLPGASPGGPGTPEGVKGYGELRAAVWLMGEVGR